MKRTTYLVGIFLVLILPELTVKAQPLGRGTNPRLSQELKKELQNHLQRDTIRVDLINRYLKNRGLPGDTVKKYALEAIRLSKELMYQPGEVEGYIAMGSHHDFKGRVDSALYYFEQAYVLYHALNNEERVIWVKHRIGVTLAKNGKFTEALERYYEVAEYYESKEDYGGIGFVYNHIGLIYDEKFEPEQAIPNYKRSINSYRRSNQAQGIIRPLVNLASVYVKLGEEEEASLLLEEAIELDREYRLGFSKVYVVSGSLNLHLEKYDEARKAFTKALEMGRRTGIIEPQIPPLQFLANTELKAGNVDDAQKYIEEAYQLILPLKKTRDRQFLELLSLYATIEKELENYSKASGLLEKALHISDSLSREENLKVTAELEAKYEVQKKEQDLQLLESEKRAERLFTILSLFIMASAFGAIGFGFVKYTKRQKKLKANEFNVVQRRMENYSILIAERDLLITYIIDKLRAMRNHFKTGESQKELNEVLDSLSRNVNLIDSEDQLFERIEQINASFFINLDARYKNLTKREKRLASLILMELPNKDVASLLRVNLKSVLQAKYRLKKKLGLQKEEDLYKFLIELKY